jgi:hypothetical protein
MKPFQILLCLLSIMFVLFLVSFYIPEKGISLPFNLNFRFITFNEIFFPKKIQYANISHLINKEIKADTLYEKNNIIAYNSESNISIDNSGVIADTSIKIERKIEFPANDSNILNPFFYTLLKHEGVIRILHYGDSQIEGDRISSFIRNKLQAKFGGAGIGLFPVVDAVDVGSSINKSHSDNWKRYTLYGKKDSSVRHNKYCVLESFSRFTPVRNDSSLNDTSSFTAWIKLINLNQYRKNIKQCRLLCGNNKTPVNINFYTNGDLLKSEILPSDNNLNIVECNFIETPEEITINFSGEDSPDIYAIALDDTKGIAVDNIAMRGSSGLDFVNTNLDLLKNAYDRLNVKMLILEFGVNVVPNEVDDYSFYENWFYAQLRALKRLKPDISIIVIGVSDMSKKTGDQYESYSNIEKIRNAQKNAAFKAGCAFWDLYLAMGGKNSMPSWVLSEPSLASKDFTHFNYEGSKIIAEMFYKSLLFEYNKFKKFHSNL